MDTPLRAKVVMHDVGLGNASPSKQYLYCTKVIVSLEGNSVHAGKQLIEPSDIKCISPCM